MNVHEKHGRLIIEPIQQAEYSPAASIDAITDQNRHDTIDVGAHVGQEAW
ncbi:transcriptional regulator [Lichenicola cladoniae]|uniref:Transcriptional regulator n=1 Tax=Lichenicola cladoniae TaxID=1484109 RepID=A0A6M8HRN3_9PROT|nr:transcriptional regulator [Lichenicola cladoniae]NPD65855.1 transcriptional regulator [Acetobacteraceae bacterium]QKE91143.1 transcriptional regulator [Lichenicola cladoniae]